MQTMSDLVRIDPQIMSGMPVFAGTRVPVWSLFHHLAAGDSLDDFLDGFPTVDRETAVRAIREAGEALVRDAHLAG